VINDPYAAHRHSETRTVHILWLSAGLSCDGESVALTAACSPALEDLLGQALPGMPRIVIYNALLAYEVGEELIAAFQQAEAGELDPFVLVVEGAVANERINGEGYWSGFGTNPLTGQPITANEWIDRLAPRAGALLAVGSCAAYGGIAAMRNNPTGAMGVPDYLGRGWRSRRGLPIVCLPGCPTQPDNMAEMLLELALYLVGMAPAPELDEALRPRRLFERTTREGCTRAGFTEQGRFASEFGADPRCLVKLGCKGPVARCNVPTRGWVAGVGGCPNVGGICIACTMPGFPDKFMPFMRPDRWGNSAANLQRFTYGPVVRYLRGRSLAKHFDREPCWRGPSPALKSGCDGGP